MMATDAEEIKFMIRMSMSIAVISCTLLIPPAACAFEGRIQVTVARGSQTEALLYTVGTNYLRVEMAATNRPDPVDILDRNSGELTLLFPNNRSFVRLMPSTENLSTPPGFPKMPGGVPPGAPMRPPGMPAAPNGMPMMPMMPPMMMEKLELQDMGEKTNILGFACERYEIKPRGQTMEIWATDQLFPFQPYVQNQPHRFGPRMIEAQWPELVKAKKLFPLLATLKFDNGVERFHFEVQSVTPQKLTDDDLKVFQTPEGYFELKPLPF
jgi:hypothetical protein